MSTMDTARAAETTPQALTVNRPPAITWHRLAMNETQVPLPSYPAASADAVRVETHGDARIEELAAQAPAGDKPLAAAGDNAEAPLPPALAKMLREAHGATTWETGAGSASERWLLQHATRHLLVSTECGTQNTEATVIVRLAGEPETTTVAVVDVVATRDAHVRLVVESDAASGQGITGALVRVATAPDAQVALVYQQTEIAGWTHLESTGACLAADARLQVTQTLLGAGQSYTGLAIDLQGDRAACDVDTRYLGHGSSVHDLNYVIRQRGRSTRANLDANGVLIGNSSKLLRGTIDLVHGCKGSKGREQETVLLADARAHNKTIPVILCDEDDVQGDHGATIGHVNPRQLEYLHTRGLDTNQAEALFVEAVLDDAANRAYDNTSREALDHLATQVLGHNLASQGEQEQQ